MRPITSALAGALFFLVAARPVPASAGAALDALRQQVDDLGALSATTIADDDAKQTYKRLDKLIKGIAEIGRPGASALLDRVSRVPAVSGLHNITSGGAKRALIDAYIAVGEPTK